MTRRGLKARLMMLLLTPFEAAIALAALVASAVYLLDPRSVEGSVLGRAAEGLLPVWELLYLTGGLAILGGLIGRSLRLEVAGLALFVAALMTQTFAIVDVTGARGVMSAATFTALGGACAGRGWVLVSRWRAWRAVRRGE